VRKGIGTDTPGCFSLQRIIPDSTGGIERLLKITGFKHMKLLLCIVPPDTGIAVRLKLHFYLQCIGTSAVSTPLLFDLLYFIGIIVSSQSVKINFSPLYLV